MSLESLQVGHAYTFEEVADAFEMKSAVLTWQGGIISRPKQNALIVITRSDLKSIDYHDYWEGDQLVYGARGQRGDQVLAGVNQLLCENARQNFVFETLGGASMRYRGIARAVTHWWARASDANGQERAVIRFLLRFSDDEAGIDEALIDSLAEAKTGLEGRRRLKQHVVLERNRGLVSDAKRHWRRLDPLLRCEVCRMSFAEVYGVRGDEFIEAHHRVPLGQLEDATETRIVDLAPVCANCHRMLHRGDECSIEQLRSEFEATRRAQ